VHLSLLKKVSLKLKLMTWLLSLKKLVPKLKLNNQLSDLRVFQQLFKKKPDVFRLFFIAQNEADDIFNLLKLILLCCFIASLQCANKFVRFAY